MLGHMASLHTMNNQMKNETGAKFLTKLFSQCHIYFNHKGHTAVCISKHPYNLNISPFILDNLSEISKIGIIEIKNILGTTEYLNKGTLSRIKGIVPKSPLRV